MRKIPASLTLVTTLLTLSGSAFAQHSPGIPATAIGVRHSISRPPTAQRTTPTTPVRGPSTPARPSSHTARTSDYPCDVRGQTNNGYGYPGPNGSLNGYTPYSYGYYGYPYLAPSYPGPQAPLPQPGFYDSYTPDSSLPGYNTGKRESSYPSFQGYRTEDFRR